MPKRPGFMEEEEKRYEEKLEGKEKGRRLKDDEGSEGQGNSEGLVLGRDRRSMTLINKTTCIMLNKRKKSCGGGRFPKKFAC